MTAPLPKPPEPWAVEPVCNTSKSNPWQVLEAELAALRAERDQAREWVRRMSDGRTVTCVYCGHAYEPGTPTAQHERLTAHIKTCPQHPMRAVAAERDRLAAALEVAEEALSLITRCKPGLPNRTATAALARIRAARTNTERREVPEAAGEPQPKHDPGAPPIQSGGGALCTPSTEDDPKGASAAGPITGKD